MGALSREQARLMRQALGLDTDPPARRNLFAATDGTPADRQWARLVELGLAEVRRVTIGDSLYNTYRVTDAGREALARAQEE